MDEYPAPLSSDSIIHPLLQIKKTTSVTDALASFPPSPRNPYKVTQRSVDVSELPLSLPLSPITQIKLISYCWNNFNHIPGYYELMKRYTISDLFFV